jgi:hypothetical protein
MPLMKPRPILKSFRALAFTGENRGKASNVEMRLDLEQDIELGVAVPTVAGLPLQVSVLIKLKSTANPLQASNDPDQAVFSGEYEAKFYYPLNITEDLITPHMEDDEYQYILVAQAYPLAMTHFRRELQAMGMDARNLPLGLG